MIPISTRPRIGVYERSSQVCNQPTFLSLRMPYKSFKWLSLLFIWTLTVPPPFSIYPGFSNGSSVLVYQLLIVELVKRCVPVYRWAWTMTAMNVSIESNIWRPSDFVRHIVLL